MEKSEKAVEKITEKRKLPKEIKEKLKSITFINLLVSIAIMLYLLAINILFLKASQEVFILSVKVFAMVICVIDIIVFEVGYRKDNILIWFHAIELLGCGILILLTQYAYLYLDSASKNIFMFAPIFFLVYYLGKSIIFYVFEFKKYQNNLSDVKEIIKDEEEGYIDDIDIEEEDDDDDNDDE